MKLNSRKDFRRRRHLRIRKKIHGTAECPRMSIMVSGKNLYVQFIDDESARTLASSSTLGKGLKLNVETARTIGTEAAEAAKEKGVTRVVVDRGGFRYHGRVRAVVEAAQEAGLSIRTREVK
jgi:large subunit ribosomal protein L18